MSLEATVTFTASPKLSMGGGKKESRESWFSVATSRSVRRMGYSILRHPNVSYLSTLKMSW
jgi:hypothetical protein